MECLYCGKTFEDPKRFEKHKCKALKNAERITAEIYQVYLTYAKIILNKKIKKDDADSFVKFLKSSLFDKMVKLERFISENQIDCAEYLNTMLFLKIQPNMWTSQDSIKKYIVYRANHENVGIAYERSKKYIIDHNININECTPGFLFNLIYNGFLSKHYFEIMKIDLKKILPKEYLDDLWEIL